MARLRMITGDLATDALIICPPNTRYTPQNMTDQQSTGASLSRNSIASILGRILYVITRIGLPPFILQHISVEAYGIWATCFVLISYIGMGAFGVSNAYIRYTAEYNAKQDIDAIGRLLGAGLLLTLAFSSLTLALVWLCMPWLLAWFKIPQELKETARILFLGTVATMLLDLTFGAFSYVLTGLQRIVQTTVVWIFSYLLEVALIVTLLYLDWGVTSLMWAFLARYVFSTLLYVILCFRAIPGLRLIFRGLRARHFRPFLGYGGILQISGLISVFLYSVEKILAGRFTGIGSVAILDVGQKFPMMSSQVFAAVTSSFLPAVTHLHFTDAQDEIRRLYLRSTRYMNLLSGLTMGYLAAFGSLVITAWIGQRPDLNDMIPVMLAATVGFQMHELTGPASAYYQGIHRPARTFEYLILQILGIGAGLAVIVYHQGYNLVAIAQAVAGARIAASLIFMSRAHRAMRLSNGLFFRQVLLPGLLPYVWGFELWFLLEAWLQGFAGQRFPLVGALVAAGMAYTVWSLGFFWLAQTRRDERRTLAKTLLRRP